MKRSKHVPLSFTVETYREPRAGHFTVDSMPSCFNDVVRVRRYRVSVEEIVEAPEVIQERLTKLYAGTTNMHHRLTLRTFAAKYGYVIG